MGVVAIRPELAMPRIVVAAAVLVACESAGRRVVVPIIRLQLPDEAAFLAVLLLSFPASCFRCCGRYRPLEPKTLKPKP